MEKRRALVSVWDKNGLEDFVICLVKNGYEIISSSGTAMHLKEAGISVTEVSDVTDFPAILGGRVKTLHPKIMGGILTRRGLPKDEEDCKACDITPIDIVICNLYPFEQTAKEGKPLDELIEKIDIGGVTLIRAAAKNYNHVAVVVTPADYCALEEEIEQYGEISISTRQSLALKAFSATAFYDAVIYDGLKQHIAEKPDEFAQTRIIPLRKVQRLRYGENPHQCASYYLPALAKAPFKQLAGKELSYNNLLDFDTIHRACSAFSADCACCIVKHTSPCGTAIGKNSAEALMRALTADPVSAFGGIIGFTREVNAEVASILETQFFEIVVAPSFAPGVVEHLALKKPNLRLLLLTGEYPVTEQITANRSGYLIQQDALPPLPTLECGKWIGPERKDIWEDMLFAWKTAAITKSNAIVIAKSGASIGIGGGFTNRVDATQYALTLAADKAQGAVLASDAFFPFPDSVYLAADAGIIAIIQPGGSIKDDEVARAALDTGISMFIGGGRIFRH